MYSDAKAEEFTDYAEDFSVWLVLFSEIITFIETLPNKPEEFCSFFLRE